jgi:uncharacterized membrane protein
MINLAVAVPTFLAACVEWVEAFTIVLAVSLTIGWRPALGAALAALAVLAAMTAATGGALTLGMRLGALQFVIGVFLLLFGVRWLAKAIARQAGLKVRHSEAEEFDRTREELARGDRYAGWVIAFKGVLLEGLEVWLIVVALGMGGGWASAAGAAVVALVVVAGAGLLVRAPLTRLPENAIKFVVGAAIVSFGTFWTVGSLAGEGVWPGGDASLVALAAFYLVGGLVMAAALRRRAESGR